MSNVFVLESAARDRILMGELSVLDIEADRQEIIEASARNRRHTTSAERRLALAPHIPESLVDVIIGYWSICPAPPLVAPSGTFVDETSNDARRVGLDFLSASRPGFLLFDSLMILRVF